ncbi:MAG TPA: serine/threonine-protein kinase [Polyangiaceae bacterium]|nr:serine/threonine-protein kinase [Polyangiaceae bacterium]
MASSGDRDRAHARVGCWLTSQWRLTKLLGIGGTSAVYEGQGATGRSVAIKVLHERHCSSEELRERFAREAVLVNRVEHPAVVKVMEYGTADEGTPFLAMELLTGETTEQRRIRAGGRLPQRDVLSIADRALGLLVEAHALGIVHRDISPSNLFVCVDDSLRVLDFGIASLRTPQTEQALTRTGEVFGTLAYMAPEQALGAHRSVDQRSDVYSLGATLFRLLTGRWVHQGATVKEQRAAIMSTSARSLAHELPEAHPYLVRLVDRALCYERSARWQTASEMQEACHAASDALVKPARAFALDSETGDPTGPLDGPTHVDLPRPGLC